MILFKKYYFRNEVVQVAISAKEAIERVERQQRRIKRQKEI
jgi:hypothetical protein